MEDSIISFLREFGFPVFVAIYLLCYELPKSRKAIEENRRASEELRDVNKELLIYLKAKNGNK